MYSAKLYLYRTEPKLGKQFTHGSFGSCKLFKAQLLFNMMLNLIKWILITNYLLNVVQ